MTVPEVYTPTCTGQPAVRVAMVAATVPFYHLTSKLSNWWPVGLSDTVAARELYMLRLALAKHISGSVELLNMEKQKLSMHKLWLILWECQGEGPEANSAGDFAHTQ